VRLRERVPELLSMLAVVVVDQLSKDWVQSAIELHDRRPLVEGLLSLSHVRNRGAAFGILSEAGLPYQALLLTLVSLGALLAIATYAWRLPAGARLPRLALALVLGGAIGNLIDRARFGYVVDFIHVFWNQHSWPDFNAADSAISVGVVLLVLDMLRSPGRSDEPKPEASAISPAGRT
jgi:signal peptidase II